MTAERVCVAQIGAPHGLHGEVKLRSFTANPIAVADYGPLENEDGTSQFEIEELRQNTSRGGDYVIVRLRGVADRGAADRLKGLKLFIPRDRLPAPEPDEFYHADLIGLRAVTREGAEVGNVIAVHDFGAGAVLEISREGDTLMMPFNEGCVPTVDIARGCIVVVLPEPLDQID
jgi:16S rRNA processing protein RimM